MLRDKNVVLNRDAIKRNPNGNPLRERAKLRHQTMIITFSDKKVSIQRLLDFELNSILVTIQLIKAD